MKILVDPHIHTLASKHAYSTIHECAQIGFEKGLEGIAVTDHAKTMTTKDDYSFYDHFFNLRVIPPCIKGLRVFRGAEIDIIDLDGTLVLPNKILKQMNLDVIIVSVHPDVPIGKPWETKEQHTNAYIKALENPYVDILGHSGLVNFEYDHDAVLLKARELGKMIEINNSSYLVRPQSRTNCREIAQRCKELGVYITVASDAHACFSVGEFDNCVKMLEEIAFPEELIANATLERFSRILEKHRIM